MTQKQNETLNKTATDENLDYLDPAVNPSSGDPARDELTEAASRARVVSEEDVSSRFQEMLKNKEKDFPGFGDPQSQAQENPLTNPAPSSVLDEKATVLKTKFRFPKLASSIAALLAVAVAVGAGAKWITSSPVEPIVSTPIKPEAPIQTQAPVQADAPIQAQTPAQTQAPVEPAVGSGTPGGTGPIEAAPVLDDVQGFEIVIDDLTEDEKIARIAEIRRLTEGWPASKRQCDLLPSKFSGDLCSKVGEETYFKCAPTGVVWRLSIPGCSDIQGILAAANLKASEQKAAEKVAAQEEAAAERASREAERDRQREDRQAERERRNAEREAERERKRAEREAARNGGLGQAS